MSDNHHHHIPKGASALRIAFFLNLSFTIIEIVGGYLTNSVAIIADAMHDLGDSLALGIAWWFEVIARRGKENDKSSYGFGRVSLLAALLNSVVLTAGSTIIITQSIPRFFNPSESHAMGMVGLAILGICINGYAAWKTSKGESLNQNIVSLHLLEDVLGWVAVLIGGIVLKFTGWNWIDPFLAVLIASYVLWNVTRKLWQIGRIFLQFTPEHVDVEQLKSDIELLPGVKGVHDLHVWSLDGENHVLTTHITIKNGEAHGPIKSAIKETISEGDFQHFAIEIDEDPEDCSMSDSK